MFRNLFGKKTEVDENKAAEFAAWFAAHHEEIRSSVANREKDRKEMMRMLDEVEAQLKKVYSDGYRGSVEFDYGGKDPEWELNLYHSNHPFLVKATQMIADRINQMEGIGWKVNVRS